MAVSRIPRVTGLLAPIIQVGQSLPLLTVYE